jgi:cob(I)alamin adenosyltransferase
MSIATRGGDGGDTSLAFGRRVPKDHPRVRAYGTVDELSSAIGLARAFAASQFCKDTILSIQRDLVRIMAVLAVDNADRPRMDERHYKTISPEDVARLDAIVADLEKRTPPFTGWVLPGDDPATAHLHHARTVCRRAEREIVSAASAGHIVDADLMRYINRLSDILWLLARDKAD